MKTIIKWFVGITLGLAGLGSMLMGGLGIISGLLLICGGLVCMPPSLSMVEAKLNTKLSSGLKYAIVIGCWVLGVLIAPKDSTKTQKSDKTALADKNMTSKDNNTTQSSAPKEPEKSASEKLKEQLERELRSDAFTKGLETDTYRGTVEALQMELVLFNLWANTIQEGEASNEENKKLASSLRKKVIAMQVAEFPKLRKAYVDIIANKLWEENITVTVQGNGNTVINLTGGLFANNKNIKQTQETIDEVVKMFRFKQIRYRWYKGENEYTYYDLKVPKDNESVELKK
jgi:hypothetical protein